MNTTLKGNALERDIYDLFEKEIAAGRFGGTPTSCKIYWKKGYYSKDREKDIVFDISIEFYLPGAKAYSILILIECKNYSHAIPVNDVEEFFTKVQQVAAANSKAILASNASFQIGTRKFAESKGIGLLRYFSASEFKWELLRSPSGSVLTGRKDQGQNVGEGLSEQDFKSTLYDLYMQSPSRETNSLWDFIGDLLQSASLTAKQLCTLENPKGRPQNLVPFLEESEFEKRSFGILQEVGYVDGEVSLDDICAREEERSGLTVVRGGLSNEIESPNPVLGRIRFAPLEIHIYKQAVANLGRERFTLAHELAHHLLSHSRYISGETCDDQDFSLRRQETAGSPEVARMEFQANLFAACLLMPRTNFVNDFHQLLQVFGISNKGFGALYVDNQPCNLQNYEKVIRELMALYGVSRAAATIRLESLSLLRDERTTNEPKGASAILNNMSWIGSGR
jgi:Zn-dependent peptidase ImmA (M78 family)